MKVSQGLLLLDTADMNRLHQQWKIAPGEVPLNDPQDPIAPLRWHLRTARIGGLMSHRGVLPLRKGM